MSEVNGKIKEINARPWKNNIYTYTFVLDGSPVVYNCGTVDPGVAVGDTIKFNVFNRMVQVPSIQKIAATEVTPPPQFVDTQAPVSDVGRRIRMQAARHDAVMLVKAGMDNGLLPMPKSTKAHEKWDRLLDLVHETMLDLIEMEDTWKKREGS